MALKMVWVLPEDFWSFFLIFLSGSSPILSDCISKLSFHKKFLFSRNREIGLLKGRKLITRALALGGGPQEPSDPPLLGGQEVF